MNSNSYSEPKKKVPKLFSKSRVVSEIINILGVKPGVRNSNQLRKLASFFEEINLFKKNNITEPSQLREICNYLKLKDYSANELVFK